MTEPGTVKDPAQAKGSRKGRGRPQGVLLRIPCARTAAGGMEEWYNGLVMDSG